MFVRRGVCVCVCEEGYMCVCEEGYMCMRRGLCVWVCEVWWYMYVFVWGRVNVCVCEEGYMCVCVRKGVCVCECNSKCYAKKRFLFILSPNPTFHLEKLEIRKLWKFLTMFLQNNKYFLFVSVINSKDDNIYK